MMDQTGRIIFYTQGWEQGTVPGALPPVKGTVF